MKKLLFIIFLSHFVFSQDSNTNNSFATADSDYVNVTGDTMTDALVLPAGTAALPALTFVGDLNTGFYWCSADTLCLTTGGVKVAEFSTSLVTFPNALNVSAKSVASIFVGGVLGDNVDGFSMYSANRSSFFRFKATNSSVVPEVTPVFELNFGGFGVGIATLTNADIRCQDCDAGAGTSLMTQDQGNDIWGTIAGETWTGAHDFTGATTTVAAPSTGSTPTTKTYVDTQVETKSLQRMTLTIPHTVFQTAGTTKTVDLITWSSGALLSGVTCEGQCAGIGSRKFAPENVEWELVTNFTGGAIASYTIRLNNTGSGSGVNEYDGNTCLITSVFAAADADSPINFWNRFNDYQIAGCSTTLFLSTGLSATAVSTVGNLDASTAGSLKLHIQYASLP